LYSDPKSTKDSKRIKTLGAIGKDAESSKDPDKVFIIFIDES
jgi:hypothetical protein